MSHLLLRGDARSIPLADESVDLIFGSPPYIDARLYLENGRDLGIARKCREWVDWMFGITVEALRVSRGPVLWVVAGKTEDRRYQPGPEGLLWRCYEAGIAAECPCYWHRVGISGSGGDQWFRKDVEYVLAFKREPKLSWSDNTAMGHPCRFEIGGAMSNRNQDGQRINAKVGRRLVKGGGGRRANGRPRNHEAWATSTGYQQPNLANPGNLIKTTVGGGQMGHDAAHLNEAPFPEALPEWFIRSLCPPGGIVLDPFSGSGTAVAVAEREGRIGIGLDLRQSQALIAQRRIERPHAAVLRPGRGDDLPLFRAEVACQGENSPEGD
jgi:hypothetical protein